MLCVNSLSDLGKATAVLVAFQNIMLSGQYAEGKNIKDLESQVSKHWNRNAISFNSCGSALYAMFCSYKDDGRKTVAIQNNTFYATGAMALKAGLKVVLVDNAEHCPCMSVLDLERTLSTNRVDLVCLTHLGGYTAQDYEAIHLLCKDRGISLVEDCAHTLGMEVPGSLGESACYSLYATKAIPAGEGGILITSKRKHSDYAHSIRQYGKCVKDKEVHYDRGLLGMNLRMSEWDAAVACVQWKNREKVIEARRRDSLALQSIASCVLRGESNHYKYPVKIKDAVGYQTVGHVYQRSDQLCECLPDLPRLNKRKNNMVNSLIWADNYVCLPIGEGLYDNKTSEEIREMVRI